MSLLINASIAVDKLPKEKFVKDFEKQLNEYGKGEFRDFAKKEFPFSKRILLKIPNVKSLTSPESLQPVKSNIPQIVELK